MWLYYLLTKVELDDEYNLSWLMYSVLILVVITLLVPYITVVNICMNSISELYRNVFVKSEVNAMLFSKRFFCSHISCAQVRLG